jgi:hypothetical protein
MKIKLLLFIILVSFAFHSCLDFSLPEKIDLEVEGTIDLPVKITTSNWAKTLIKSLSGSFPRDVEIYNVNHGQTVQAFCVYIPMEISNSLNPEDHLTSMKMDLAFNVPITIPSYIELASQHISISPGGSVSISLPGTPGIPLVDIGGFLQAKIKEGSFNINILDGNGYPMEGQFTITYNIDITQEQDTDSPGSSPPYDGFNNPSTNVTQAASSLEGKYINSKPIGISGTIDITNLSGAQVEGNLIVSMNIKKLSAVYWDITGISQAMNESDSVSLEEAAEFLNWLEFDKCDGTPQTGIGINMIFDEIHGALEMKVNCDDLRIDQATNKKPLTPGDNAFGNQVALEETTRLQLVDPGKVEELKFTITLSSSVSSPNFRDVNVIYLNELDLEQEEPPRIKGATKFFQNWKRAEVNMEAALNADKGDGEDDLFEGQFPSKNEEEIDLSLLRDYLPGFSFNNIQAAAYLNGPDKAINDNTYMDQLVNNMSLSITAQYRQSEQDSQYTSSAVMPDTKLKLEEEHFDIGKYLDEKKEAYIIDGLPPEGKNDFSSIKDVINAMPKGLFFQYKINMPEKLIVTPKMFENENEENAANNITANIILLMDLDLTAGDELVLADGSAGARIMLPDMFQGQTDLLGRETPGDSMFTSLDVEYIKFTIDFTDAFFTGGNFFIEKEGCELLFPDGIPVDGRSIAVDINKDRFDIIKENLINPDFRLEFKSGEEITIPRNIGVTSVKIEAKGKSSFTLDF